MLLFFTHLQPLGNGNFLQLLQSFEGVMFHRGLFSLLMKVPDLLGKCSPTGL